MKVVKGDFKKDSTSDFYQVRLVDDKLISPCTCVVPLSVANRENIACKLPELAEIAAKQ